MPTYSYLASEVFGMKPAASADESYERRLSNELPPMLNERQLNSV